ncbi:MAG: DUF3857 domain-containing protein [Bacteroidota bacterium]
MKYFLKTLLILLVSYSASAQLYKKHDWKESQEFYELTETEKQLPSIAIKEKYLIQYYQPAIAISAAFRLFETKHSIIRVNTDKGIKTHNRVYIPMYNVKKVIDIKARVTQRDGKVKVLNKRNIKELENVENYGNFKIFAIEGVTKDSQLEFIYTLEKYIRSIGSVVVQKDYEVKEAEVILRKPRVLSYRVKEYNGFPKMVTKTVEGNKEALTTTATNIDAMTDEMSASPTANRMKMFYQVAAGGFGSTSEMWDGLETNLIDNYIKIKPKKYNSLIKDYTAFVKEKPAETQAQIINNICEYVTSNFNIIRKRDEQLSEMKYIVRTKQASESGIIKVYSCLFNHEDIDYEFVLTSDRFKHKFDRLFYSSSNLQISLFYFIEEKKYIEPDNVNTRLNFAPPEAIGNDAIFVNKGGRRFRIIESPKASNNTIERDYTISIDIDEVITKVACEQKNTGYRAKNARGAYKYLKNRDFDNFKQFTGANGIEDAEFETFEVNDEALSLGTDNIPVRMNYSYTTESLIEEINEDIMLNFGKVIGTQNELYQEAKRVNPVELNSLIRYTYKIEIIIPDGYEAKGLDAIKISKVVDIDGQPACQFISDYTLDNNILTIKVIESYDSLEMPLQYYEGYKDVVNSAYDFSKLSILLKQKV